MATQDLRKECIGLCQVSLSLDASNLTKLEQLVEVLKAHLQSKVARFLEKQKHTAILVSYSSDATPLLVASTSNMSTSSLGSTTRSGRQLLEFLMQKSFYKSVDADGQMAMVVMLKDPLPLSAGKRGWNMFTAAAEFEPLLRRAGHPSICLQHMSADRLVFSSLGRHLRGRQAAYYDPQHGPDLGPEAPLLWQTDWMLSNPSAVHDAHNALKWGLSAVTESSTLEDLHIIFEALRNSFAALRAHIGPFLHAHLRPRDPPVPASEAESAIWTLLGAEPEWVEVLVSLNPLWSSGWLWVNELDDQDTPLIAQVSHLIFHMMRWRQFTESRWASLGASCRALLATLLLGLSDIVAITREDPCVSEYHLGGFERLSDQVLQYAITTAAGSYPMENFILSLLNDDRLLKCLPELEEDIQEEMHYLQTLPEGVWMRLAGLSPELSAPALQSTVLMAAQTSIAYLQDKTLSQARELKGSLTLGNIDFNLHQLAVLTVPPSESVASKIWHLMRAGYCQKQLHDAVRLFQEVPWSTQGVECSHGSLSSIHKYHPQYGLATLAGRAMLHQARALFSTDPTTAGLQRRQQQLEKLQRSMSRSVSARNVFLAELVATVQAGSGTPQQGRTDPHHLVRLSHQLYQQLDDAAKLRYELPRPPPPGKPRCCRHKIILQKHLFFRNSARLKSGMPRASSTLCLPADSVRRIGRPCAKQWKIRDSRAKHSKHFVVVLCRRRKNQLLR